LGEAMATSTHVGILAPRQPLGELPADDALPADLTVSTGDRTPAVPGSVPLHDFIATARTLTPAASVTRARAVREKTYVPLPLKSAMHAVNPVQRLRLLRARLERQDDDTM